MQGPRVVAQLLLRVEGDRVLIGDRVGSLEIEPRFLAETSVEAVERIEREDVGIEKACAREKRNGSTACVPANTARKLGNCSKTMLPGQVSARESRCSPSHAPQPHRDRICSPQADQGFVACNDACEERDHSVCNDSASGVQNSRM